MSKTKSLQSVRCETKKAAEF